MSKKKSNVRRLDCNRMAAPMTGFVRVANPEQAESLGIVATFENNKYGVFLKTTKSDGFAMPGPDGKPRAMDIVHLIIIRFDKKKIEIPWAEKQAIKNELLGPMTEALELFPAEMRRMISIADHQTHLWALVPGAQIPVGLIPKAMQEMAREDALNKFTVNKDELELYTVEDGDVVQVYGSREEAAAGYEESGNEMPEGTIGRIGEVPVEGDGVAWSDAAKKKVANVLNKAEQLDRLMNRSSDEPVQSQRVNTNGPPTDQDELEDEYGVDHESPNGDEENVMMPEFMKMGVEAMREERIASIGEAVDKLAEKIEQDEKSEEEEAESEQKAGDELAEMREKMREERDKSTKD